MPRLKHDVRRNVPLKSMRNQSWNWHVALIVSISLAYQPRAWSQSTDERSIRFPTEAIVAWDKYAEFSSKVQGVIRHRDLTTFHENGKRSETNSYYRVGQNKACVSLTSQSNTEYVYILISNQSYTSGLRQEPGADNTIIIQDIVMRPDAVLPQTLKPLRAYIFPLHSPHFSYKGLPLRELAEDAAFVISGIGEVQFKGEKLERVDFSYRTPGAGSIGRGYMLLDPSRFWCIRLVEETFEMKRNQSTGGRRTEYEVSEHESGFPLAKAEIATTDGSNPSRGKTTWVRTVNLELSARDDVPDEEFRLSHFGLPEPVGVEWPKPKSKFPWILGAAGASLALAALFFYLKRRRPVAGVGNLGP